MLASLSRNLMNFLDIHHLVIVDLLIHNIFLSVLLCQCILILVISALLCVGTHLLGIQEIEVDSRLLTVFNDHLKLVCESKNL